jgi:selenocysteine-specific elongation factor
MTHVAILDGERISPGESRFVQLRLDRPLAVAPGDRFVVRTSMAGLADGRLTTVGGGQVLGTSNIRLRRNRPWTIAALGARRDAIGRPKAWCEAHLKEANAPLSVEDLARRSHLRGESVARTLDELKSQAKALEIDGEFVHRDIVDQASGRIAEQLEAFHRANPTRAGIEQADLLAQTEADPLVQKLALEELLSVGKVVSRGQVVALAGMEARVSPEDQALCDEIEQALREAALSPPLPADLAASLGVDDRRFNTMVRLLIDEGKVIQLDRKVIMHRQSVEAARDVALSLFAEAASFETVTFRDKLGVSRKFAVPLLDYFDKIHLTVRSGSRRTPGTEAKNRL